MARLGTESPCLICGIRAVYNNKLCRTCAVRAAAKSTYSPEQERAHARALRAQQIAERLSEYVRTYEEDTKEGSL